MNTTTRRLSPTLLLLLRMLVGGIFLWAGWVKIPEPGLFAQTVRAYEILPLPLVNPFAIIVPWIEVMTGLCLIFGFWTRSSALVALFLLFFFGVALGVNLFRGAGLSCGCFGLDGANGSPHFAVLRDLILICCAFILFWSRHPFFSVDHFLNQRRN